MNDKSLDHQILGRNIKKLRDLNKISQENLAHQADVKYSNLLKIENGVIKRPSVYTVAKLAKALDVTVEDLIYKSI